MNDPSVACIGAGYWGRNLIRNFHALGVLRRICESDAAVALQLGKDYPGVPVSATIDPILADPAIAAVVIATPAETHGRIVRQALAAGKDVFVEKPLCLSLEEGLALKKLAEGKGRILMVGHLLWYHPAILALKKLVDEGALGKIRYLYSHRLNLGKIRKEENILWSFAPHVLSVILGLLGEMPVEVRTQGGNYLNQDIADVTVSVLSFPSGVKAHVFVSWLHPFKEQKLVVVGDRQMAVFDDLEEKDKLVLYPHVVEWKDGAPRVDKKNAVPVPVEMQEPLRLECRHFLDCVLTRSRPRTDADEGLRVLEVLSKCQAGLVAPLAKSYTAHPSAFIDDGVVIGAGTRIWHVAHLIRGSRIGRNCSIGQNAVVGPNVTVGAGVKIQNNVSVYEGVTLEAHVFCGPSVVFTNVYNPRSEIKRMHELRQTRVRQGASLGANATIVCGVTVGRYAFVGAGAVVLRDVPDHALVVGNPARIAGWMCSCGNRIDFCKDPVSAACGSCAKVYRKDGNVGVPA